MDAFQDLLEENIAKPKNELGKFEMHQVQRDSTGKERYLKTPE